MEPCVRIQSVVSFLDLLVYIYFIALIPTGEFLSVQDFWVL